LVNKNKPAKIPRIDKTKSMLLNYKELGLEGQGGTCSKLELLEQFSIVVLMPI
jgi:hypothetical protein